MKIIDAKQQTYDPDKQHDAKVIRVTRLRYRLLNFTSLETPALFEIITDHGFGFVSTLEHCVGSSVVCCCDIDKAEPKSQLR
jgi:hypothetical protein